MEPTQEQQVILQQHAQIQALVAERDNATALLGRMTLERDNLQSQIDLLRGEKIALQERCAKQSRTADQLKREHQEATAAKSRENAEAAKRMQEQGAAVAQNQNARLEDQRKELDVLRKLLVSTEAERDDGRKLLEKYEPQIKADKARAELAELERQEQALARKKAEAQKAVDALAPAEPHDRESPDPAPAAA